MSISTIKVLDSHVVDQISAGEVLERPAQLVKELIENAIDAGASKIELDISQGGKMVSIKDDGRGMGPEDLSLAFLRHATSKIRESDDIWNLKSFGFRGEALASVGAVSDAVIVSREKGGGNAYSLRNSFGDIGSVEESSHEEGTTIEVKDLFAHLPARLKFLKSDVAEMTQIKKVIKAMALENFNVEFLFKQSGKLIFFWGAKDNLLSRAEEVLDKGQLFAVEFEFSGLRMKGCLSPPNSTVRNAQQIWIFVQGRWIQDRSLQAALLDGYRSFLMHGEYPVASLHIELDPELVDVNVSPTKSQVKFAQPSDAYRLVLKSVRSFLESAPWLEGLAAKTSIKQNITLDSLNEESSTPLGFIGQEFEKTQYPQKVIPEVKPETLKNYAQTLGEISAPLMETYHSGEPVSLKENYFDSVIDTLPENSKDKKVKFWQNFQIIGQAHLTYIVIQSDEAMIFIDQHAAHERVAYERLMEHWKNKNIEVQNYLLAENFELEEDQVEALLQVKESLEDLGLFIDQGGPTTITLRGAPALIKSSSILPVLEKTAEEVLQKTNSFALESSVRDLCATMACHSVVRAGQSLSLEQMQSLLVQMDEYYTSSFCPHGRPVYVEYKFSKLERDFGRIV